MATSGSAPRMGPPDPSGQTAARRGADVSPDRDPGADGGQRQGQPEEDVGVVGEALGQGVEADDNERDG